MSSSIPADVPRSAILVVRAVVGPQGNRNSFAVRSSTMADAYDPMERARRLLAELADGTGKDGPSGVLCLVLGLVVLIGGAVVLLRLAG